MVEQREQLEHDIHPHHGERLSNVGNSSSLHNLFFYVCVCVIMPAPQCAAIKPANPKKKQAEGRCKLRTKMRHPFCWIHTRQKLHVSVKDSAIEGKGLFAEKDFLPTKKDKNNRVVKSADVICEATGVKHTEEGWGEKAPDSNHYIISTKGFDMDMEDPTKSSVARYANHCIGEAKTSGRCKKNNAYMSNHNGKLTIRAQTKVNKGDEILWSYGKKFWGSTGGEDEPPPQKKQKKKQKKKKKPIKRRGGKEERIYGDDRDRPIQSGKETVRRKQAESKRKRRKTAANSYV
jgi:hypothetical protein